jgi:hypothetical protein
VRASLPPPAWAHPVLTLPAPPSAPDPQTGEPLANFYLDPYARPETKRGGAWMDSLYGRSKVLGRKPVAYLTCNGSPPTGDKPALMTFSEVRGPMHRICPPQLGAAPTLTHPRVSFMWPNAHPFTCTSELSIPSAHCPERTGSPLP